MSGRGAASRRRLDVELVRRGMASSRTEAAQLIAEGRVWVGGAPGLKASALVRAGDRLTVDAPAAVYASRGGHKLAGALDAFGIDPAARHCLDAGASAGGFTDVLLRRGAARVIAIDVGYGQLAWPLRRDPRVVVMERFNVRYLTSDDIPPPAPDLVVADLSFISLRLVLGALRAAAAEEADHLLLVKPQFEAGPERVGKGGVVRDPQVWREAMRGVAEAGAAVGLGLSGAAPSTLPGPAGNVEFFLHLRSGARRDIASTVEEAAAQGGAVSDR